MPIPIPPMIMGMMPCAGVLATPIDGGGVIGMPTSAAPAFAAMTESIMSAPRMCCSLPLLLAKATLAPAARGRYAGP
jgi:hypothetical protein